MQNARDERDPDLEPIEALHRARRRAALRMVAFMAAGAVIALVVHSLPGRPPRTFPLWATPERAAVYGMVFGLIVGSL